MSDVAPDMEAQLQAVIADYRNAEDALTRLRAQYAKLQAASSQLEQARADLDRDRTARGALLAGAAEQVSDQVAHLASIVDRHDDVVTGMGEAAKALAAVASSIEGLDPAKISRDLDELRREVAGAGGEVREARRTLADVERQLNEHRSALTSQDEQLQSTRASVDALRVTTDAHLPAMKLTGEATTRLLDQHGKSQEALRSEVAAVNAALQRALGVALVLWVVLLVAMCIGFAAVLA